MMKTAVRLVSVDDHFAELVEEDIVRGCQGLKGSAGIDGEGTVHLVLSLRTSVLGDSVMDEGVQQDDDEAKG